MSASSARGRRDLLAAAVGGTPPGTDGAPRHGAVVALGLLGEPTPIAEAVPDPASALDLEAFVLAATLADPATALAAATDAYRYGRGGPALDAADAAAARLEAGDILGVVG